MIDYNVFGYFYLLSRRSEKRGLTCGPQIFDLDTILDTTSSLPKKPATVVVPLLLRLRWILIYRLLCGVLI